MEIFLKRLIVFFGLLFLSISYALSEYIVKKGDTLSDVVKTHFPGMGIYGTTGKLQDLLKLNPHLINPNFILPGDRILLEERVTGPASVTVLSQSEELEAVGEVEIEADNSGWLTTMYYGARYTQFSQSGGLAGADLGVLLLNEVTFRTEYRHDDLSWGLGLNTYRFEYSDSTEGSGSERLTHLDLFLAKKWFIAGLGVMDQPIFRNTATSVEMGKQTLTYMKVGFLKKSSLTQFKNTNLNFKTHLMFPFKFSSPNKDIDIKSATSIGLESEVELERDLYFNEFYNLSLTWLMSFNYLKISEEVKWGDQTGSADINSYGIASSLGLKLKF